MSSIAQGSVLVIDSGAVQETVTVTATTATTFSAVTAHPHNGTVTPFAIVSQASPNIGQGWLNFLAVSQAPDPTTAASLHDVLAAVLDFARIKQDLSPSDDRLLTVLRDPAAKLPSGASALLTLTGWSQDSLDALLTRFFGTTQLANLSAVENLHRVYDASSLVTTCGISAAALIAATTNDPVASIVRDLQSALRARYAEADWLTVVKPINDTMRDRQRDALVAYILQRLGDQPPSNPPAPEVIDTPDKLFEYFLMDVQMEPCMQTSRIRHALSSIQLFIERCIRNLEPAVSPQVFDPDKAKQWAWMKRYRVWQANREVFLWPENWLDPELRDDPSPFFKEALSELLQGDITDDAAETAYLNYLTKLEHVAKLEPCGMHYVPSDPDKANEVAYVVARTAGAHRKYYFRRLEGGSWTPWEEMKLDIEDTPVTPFVWNGRLLVFWLKILKQTPVDPSQSIPPAAGEAPGKLTDLHLSDLRNAAQGSASQQVKVTVQAVLCWSEYANGKWQPAKTSDPNRPTTIGSFSPAGTGAFDRKNNQLQIAKIQIDSYVDDMLVVRISVSGNRFLSTSPAFLLHNTHSAHAMEDVADRPSWAAIPWRLLLTSYQGSKDYVDPNVAYPPSAWPNTFSIMYVAMEALPPHFNDVLKSPLGERVVVPHPLADSGDAWDAPFFFEDSRNVFYVTTSERFVSLPNYAGFGVGLGVMKQPGGAPGMIPGLVLQTLQKLPDKAGPVIVSTPIGLTDPLGMQKFVNDSTTIRIAIGSNAGVSYQGRQIGLGGSQVDGQLP